jgi:hypothetical protein
MAIKISKLTRKKLAIFCIDSVKPFVNKEVLESFRYVISEVERKKILKKGEIQIVEESPWIRVKLSTNPIKLETLFVNNAWHSFSVSNSNKKPTLQSKPTRLLEKKEHQLLIEQHIWEILIGSLIISLNNFHDPEESMKGKLFYRIGYLHGVHHLDRTGRMNRVWSGASPMHHVHMNKARNAKKSMGLKRDFMSWADGVHKSGGCPKNLNELHGFSGFRKEWSDMSKETQKKWSREAGFKFRSGRPKK